ncbi:MAG: alpha-amylase family glycosyl hydrolase [Lysobacterales bacterium]
MPGSTSTLRLGLATVFLSLAACSNAPTKADVVDPYQPKPYVQLRTPEWARDAAIYQLNTRQFTPEGTFRAAERELPRLKALGVKILWLMPVHEIGVKNRKGGLGSPYSVRDYYSVNPEFGTLADLKHFVAAAHDQGFKVILDWVANHTAWDNPLVAEHPDWYERDWKGDFRPTPWWDWADIIDLDYSQPGLRRYMTEALKYWVREVDIDGYRCDVAGFVPVDFWDNVRRELDAIKPVFMLAEWESRDLHARAFDMTYAWSWVKAMHEIAKGRADVNALYVYYSWNESAFPREALRMVYTSNHDENSWEGTGPEQFGDALPAAIVLSVVGEGLPLIYNSQEAGESKRLAFFEKDPIEWQPSPIGELFTRLLALKKQHSALWNGRWGARMVHVPNSAPAQVLSFVRRDERSQILAVLNLSAQAQTVSLHEALYPGPYRDVFSGQQEELRPETSLSLAPWAYRVYARELHP